MRRRLACAIALVAFAVAALTASPALAVLPPPDPPRNCALAAGDWYGVGVGRDGDVVVDFTVWAKGCLARQTATHLYLGWAWNTTGQHVYEAIFYYQIVDCATGTVSQQITKEYPTGTTATVVSGSTVFTVPTGHRYQVRVTGGGEVQHGGVVASFNRYVPLHTPPLSPFLAQNSECD